MEIRRSLQNIERSGIKGLLDKCTLNNFQTLEPWQTRMKQKAQEFLTDHSGKWFYAGGQVGGGKTHICTAICGELLKQGKAVRYMLWRDEVTRLKAAVNDASEYGRLITPLKTAPVLYVDDFFKTSDEIDPKTGETRKKSPTPADVNVAFEILNYRYINSDLVTIISSERSIDDLISCDEATGSRIYQRTKDYCCYINPGENRNYRLR
jgi:DNA replication protein DnaC